MTDDDDGKLRVVLVDPDPASRARRSAALTSAGYRVEAPSASDQALARLVGAPVLLLGDAGDPAETARGADALEDALGRLWVAFQPIVLWSERLVLGYEALVRSASASLGRPDRLFAAASRVARVRDLGRAVRAAVAAAATTAPAEALLFVNLDAEELGDPDLYAPGAPLSAIARRVVLEITDRQRLAAVPDAGARVARLRRLGYRIGVDDLGAGYASITGLTQLEPDFVKLDRSLVDGIESSPRKRSVVRAMLRLCARELGIQVIGLGIETAAERDALVGEGCDVLQGHLFARPERGFPAPRF